MYPFLEHSLKNFVLSVSWTWQALLLPSCFSCVWLCATPQTAAHQAPRPWDSPGKNIGVGCHFLLQCMKVKSESEVAQSCPTLRDPMDCSLPGPSIHGIFRARVLEWGPLPSPMAGTRPSNSALAAHCTLGCSPLFFRFLFKTPSQGPSLVSYL